MLTITDFPKTLEVYKVKIPYATRDEMEEIVTTIAQKISHLYARLLTSEGHAERNKKLGFTDYPSSFPSNKEVNFFEAQLTQEIIDGLFSNSSLKRADIKLTTDYWPEKLLLNILNNCNISSKTYYHDFRKYFPWKTCTKITLDFKSQILKIDMCPRNPLLY
jgi:hypothetical protein